MMWGQGDFQLKLRARGKPSQRLPGFTCRPLTLLCVCVCVCVCVQSKSSSKCVNPFFLVAVAGPPSCFSPHIITILLLPPPPPVTPTLRLQLIRSLGPSSKGFMALRAIGTHAHTHYMCIATHSHRETCLPSEFGCIFFTDVPFRGQQSLTQSDLLDTACSRDIPSLMC